MEHFLKGLFFLLCVFFVNLSAAHAKGSEKFYFDSSNLEISDNIIYIHLEDHLIATNVLRTDQQGFYIFETDIASYEMAREKMWKCPYCYHWWSIGQKCENPECPTNKW